MVWKGPRLTMELFKAHERWKPWKGTSSDIAPVIECASTLVSKAQGLSEPKTQIFIVRSRSETELASAAEFRAHFETNRLSNVERILVAAGEDAKAAEDNPVKFLIVVDIDARPLFGAVDLLVQGTDETHVGGSQAQLVELLKKGERGRSARVLHSQRLAVVAGAILGFAIGSTAVAGLNWLTASAFGIVGVGALVQLIGRKLVPPIELVETDVMPRAQTTRKNAMRIATWAGGLVATAVVSAIATKVLGD